MAKDNIDKAFENMMKARAKAASAADKKEKASLDKAAKRRVATAEREVRLEMAKYKKAALKKARAQKPRRKKVISKFKPLRGRSLKGRSKRSIGLF